MTSHAITDQATADNQPTTPLRILFLCTGNSARSQIAEALMTKKAAGRFYAGSAGTMPQGEVHADAVSALQAAGIDWTEKRPKGIESVLDQRWDMIIIVCDRAKETCPVIPGEPIYAHWGVPDPSDIEDDALRRQAFAHTMHLLSWRLDLMLALSLAALERSVVEHRLESIGRRSPGEVASTRDRS